MSRSMKIAAPERVREHLDGQLPPGIELGYYIDVESAEIAVSGAEIGWIDIEVIGLQNAARIVEAGAALKWVSTSISGVELYPLELFQSRDIVFTNGAGVSVIPVAEFALAGILALAKNLPEIIGHQLSGIWRSAQGSAVELLDSKALILGYGVSGRAIADRLRSMGVAVTGVRRTPGGGEEGVIGLEDWRARLAEFDWVVVAAPSTPETYRLIGASELARMKSTAFLINIARGQLIDQSALIAAVNGGGVAGAFLDVTDPEPAQPNDPVWSTPGIVVTSHVSGFSPRMRERGASVFLDNLERYLAGQPLRYVVDPVAGY